MDICPIGATFLFTYFPLEVLETTIPFGLLRLAEQLVPCSAPANALARLRLFANTVSNAPFKFRSCLGMAKNTPSSVYKPLHEYQILRVSNSPHLCELCTTLSVVTQHLPLCTVPSFTKRPVLP
ncbi:hypothetical protein B296_00051717 [Ensete ventricosum]|uniref:Uncharacterized protein n=1 Tax=Ensete ventricosum TaxID=4639 RepID=A0A426XKW1_ENSVE|nr:hypothetical protein B296_00051717 [Ensete ventricosum]